MTYYATGSALPAGTNTTTITKCSLLGSHVNRATGNMTLDTREPDALTWAAAYQFGHLLGLQDRYSLDILASIGSRRRVTGPDPATSRT